MVKPRKPLNEYSKANWGDHIEMQEGHTIRINSTSDLVAVVSKLKDRQWEKIFAAAMACSWRRKNMKKSTEVVSPLLSPSQAALVEPRDDDSDLTDD
jgi:hypothetical protein